MKKWIPAIVACTALILVVTGFGCKRDVVQSPTPEQVMREFDQAAVVEGREYAHITEEEKKSVTITIPSSWKDAAPVWRPESDSKSHIRIAYFTSQAAENAWTKQQEEDVHQVLKAERFADRFVLIVYHSGLKATLVKVFVPSENGLAGYAFGECRIADRDREKKDVWNACKTAVLSVHEKNQ